MKKKVTMQQVGKVLVILSPIVIFLGILIMMVGTIVFGTVWPYYIGMSGMILGIILSFVGGMLKRVQKEADDSIDESNLGKQQVDEIVNYESGKKCPHCGAIIASDAKFCSKCGKKIANVCEYCGTELEENQKFCPNCGKKQ